MKTIFTSKVGHFSFAVTKEQAEQGDDIKFAPTPRFEGNGPSNQFPLVVEVHDSDEQVEVYHLVSLDIVEMGHGKSRATYYNSKLYASVTLVA